MKIYVSMTAVFLVLMFMAGCGGEIERENGKISIVATTGMIGDLAANIGGQHVEVVSLMGPGVDPHLYKASERDVGRMSEADIIFFNGLHLEGAIAEVLDRLGDRKITVAVAGLIPDSMLLSPSEYEGSYDPHVWFDVRLWMKAAEIVHHTLVNFDDDDDITPAFDSNLAAYMTKLEELHRYVLDRADEIPENQRVLITAHDAFNYFGRAYGFEVRGLQGISTSSEAGTADVQKLSEFIASRKIPALFIESSVPVRSIEAVQAAVKSRGFDVKIGGELYSDAMGTAGTPEGTYVGMVRHNIDTIVEGLTIK